MSSPDSLYSVVHARFHEAFGTPHHVEGGGEQWTLQPAPQHSGSIHVLLNGAPWRPGVWVFDPHDGPTVEERQIGDLIHLIQRRLHHANRERDNSTTSDPPSPPQEA